MFKSIRTILSVLDPSTRLHFALLLVPMGIVSAVELISIGMVLPVIQVLVIGEPSGYIADALSRVFPDGIDDQAKVLIAGSFAVVFVFKNILLLIMIHVLNTVVRFKTATYRRKLFQIYLKRPLIYHFRHNSADLLNNVIMGVGLSLDTIRLSLMIVLDGFLLVTVLSLLIFVEPAITVGTALTLGVVGVTFYFVASPIFKRWGERSRILEVSMIRWVNQSLAGIRDAKIFQAGDYLTEKFGAVVFQHSTVFSRTTTAIQIPRLLIETVVVIGFLGIVFALLASNKSPTEIVSVLGLFGMASLRLMPSLNRILSATAEIHRRTGYVDTIHEAFRPNKYDMKSDSSYTGTILPFTETITLQGLNYTYPDAEHHALIDFNLDIKKGTSIGFVGSSGAGKSTLMDIVLGLLEPTTGHLLVDGQDAFDNLSGWQRNIGFVPQQVFIMDDTIRRNIAFGIEDDEIDEDRLKEVLRLTRLDGFVGGLAEGLATMLGEHGSRLSGGQRQRIAIARALYRDPDILVFDEATSALDNVTEKEISEAIESLSGDKTILIVAHRLSTVRNCDQIVFMENGTIAAMGSYDELSRGNDEFKKMALLDVSAGPLENSDP